MLISSALSPLHDDKSASSRPITGPFCLFWGYSKVTPLVTKKKREKAPLFEGFFPPKKRVFWGKQRSTEGRRGETKIKQGWRGAHSHTSRHDAHRALQAAI